MPLAEVPDVRLPVIVYDPVEDDLLILKLPPDTLIGGVKLVVTAEVREQPDPEAPKLK